MNGNEIIPVILCGGSGTRLWPLSRSQRPKQFLKLLGERSLFQETVLRARALDSTDAPMIVGNKAHRYLMLNELAELGLSGIELLLEPTGRNTAPALAAAAIYATRGKSDPLLLAMPADHHIKQPERFAAAIRKGLYAARHESVVVFGVTPTQPHTGYGYIRKGQRLGKVDAYRVGEFKEKPDLQTAAAYIACGEYLWNSGIFLMRAKAYLQELAEHAPDIANSAAAAIRGAKQNGQFLRLGREAFSNCRSESVDYAVMEHTRSGVVVEMDAGWSDLGSWLSLREVGGDAADNNVTRGDVLLTDVTGSVVHSSGRLVAAVGLRDQVVVETPDAVFVAPIERAQEVKQLVTTLQNQHREEVETHLRVYRPWGWYESLTRGERVQVKRLQLKPGASVSLQLHHHFAEHWVVVQGKAEVTRNEEVFTLCKNQSTYIPQETKHRLRNPGTQPLEIIEVQTGPDISGNDVVQYYVDNQRRIKGKPLERLTKCRAWAPSSI